MRGFRVAIWTGPDAQTARGVKAAVEAAGLVAVVVRDPLKFLAATNLPDALVATQPTWAMYDAMCRGTVVVTSVANRYFAHLNNCVRAADASPNSLMLALAKIVQDRRMASIIGRQARCLHTRCSRDEFVSGFAVSDWASCLAAPPPVREPEPSAPPRELLTQTPPPTAEQPPSLVSVIMPCFNDRDVLMESVSSALSQSWPSLELIVVDDGSTDGTRDLLSSLRDDRITVAYKRNGGPSSARNLGLRLLSPASEYVAFLDSDDIWRPSFLEKTVGALRGGADAVGLAYCDSELSVDGLFREVMNPEYTWAKLIGGWGLIPTGAFAVRRSAVDQAGPFDDDIERGEDLEWMWRIGLRYDFVHVREVLHHYRRSSGGQLNTATMNIKSLDRKRRQYLAIRSPSGPPTARSCSSGGRRTLAPGAKREARRKEGAK